MSDLIFSAVVAMDPNRLIGKEGGMPWHISDDLKLFRRLTTGHPVVMGRKTYDSLGKPLPGRQNIVLTRDREWSAEGVQTIGSLDELEEMRLMDNEVCIIGGSQVYALAMPKVDLLWVSRVRDPHQGDTWFPSFEEEFPCKRQMADYPDFDLWLYARDASRLDSAPARRLIEIKRDK